MAVELLLLLAACVADPGDHLQPLDAPLGDHDVPAYEATVQRLLLVDGVRYAQMLVMPSFEAPFAVYIVRSSEPAKATVVSVRAEKNVWYALSDLMQNKLSTPVSIRSDTVEDASRYLRIGTEVVRADIDEKTAKILIDLWDSALLATRYPATMNRPEDGTTYVFAEWVQDFGYRAGRTWGWDGDRINALIKVGNLLAAYAAAPAAERVERATALREDARAQQRAWCNP